MASAVSPLDDVLARSLDLQPRTRELYRECVRDFIAYAGTTPSRWTCSTVENWLHQLLTVGRAIGSRARGPCKPQTVGVYRKAIRYASRQYAKRLNDERADFARNTSCVKTRPGPAREPLTMEEAQRLLNACPTTTLAGVRDRAIIVTALRTGLRRGGLHALDIAGVRPPKITTINKGGDPITFEADTETFAALQAWLIVLGRAGYTTGAVFRTVMPGGEIGERLSPFQIWGVFRTRANQAGLRHIFPHLARHSTVTWLREAGKSSAEVAKLTGQTERTIENIYTHVRTEGAVSAVLPSLLPRRP